MEGQNADGSWPAAAHVDGGRWGTALAVLALAQIDRRRSEAVRGVQWLLRREGRGGGLASLVFRVAPGILPTGLNPTLKGWLWTSNTFAWAEPSSYALMALKKMRPHIDEDQMDERIHQGELLLYDRACEDGGWNYGNPNVLGEELWPYPDVTAVALIALQDRMDEQFNQTSLQTLVRMLPDVDSGMTLSWSILCLSLYGQDVSDWRKKLTRVFREHRFLGRTKSVDADQRQSYDSNSAPTSPALRAHRTDGHPRTATNIDNTVPLTPHISLIGGASNRYAMRNTVPKFRWTSTPSPLSQYPSTRTVPLMTFREIWP